MIYKYIKKDKNRLIIVLHGTGGDESSLISLAEYIDEKASILGIRGNVNENGLNRYFKRSKPGVFDIENLLKETKNLKNFIDKFIEENDFNQNNILIMGYSNGANILGSLLFNYGKIFKGACLLHPMVPLRDFALKNLNNIDILMTASNNDPIVSLIETNDLAKLLRDNFGNVSVQIYNQGHSISNAELNDIKNWYNKIYKQ